MAEFICTCCNKKFETEEKLKRHYYGKKYYSENKKGSKKEVKDENTEAIQPE